MFNKTLTSLTTNEKKEILENYKVLRTKGEIGDCLLRTITKKINNDFGQSFGDALSMENIAKEVALIVAYDNFSNPIVNSDEVNLGIKIFDETTKESKNVSFDEFDINSCPFCKSEDITFDDIETDDCFAYRTNHCECGCEWEERFELTQIRIIK